MSSEQIEAGLDALVSEIENGNDLFGFAAKDAAATLVDNWKKALRDGTPLTDLVDDVDKVAALLAEFKNRAATLATPAPTPR